MANTQHNRSKPFAERISEDSSWKPLALSSKKFSSMSNRNPYSSNVVSLVGSSLTTNQYSVLLLGADRGRDGRDHTAAGRQVDMMPEERLTSRSRDPIHCAATLTMTIDPKTPFDTYPPMPTEPRQMCHEMRVGEPTIRGKDDRTTERQPLNRFLQHLLIDVIGHTAAILRFLGAT